MNKEKKNARYERITNQLIELFDKTENRTAKMVTALAVLHHKMDTFFWSGFYFLDKGKLTVGPYQGSVACLVLATNTGVCWAAINQKKSLIVPDVEEFPGHIACDSRTRSEIVIPIFDSNDNAIGVLDVDSKELDSFDEVDKRALEKIINLIF